MARRYHEDSRASAELDPVFRKLWEDGAKEEPPRPRLIRMIRVELTPRPAQRRLRSGWRRAR
jgi:hypothetical protein